MKARQGLSHEMNYVQLARDKYKSGNKKFVLKFSDKICHQI